MSLLSPPYKRVDGSDGGEASNKQGGGHPRKIHLLVSDWLIIWEMCPPYPREKNLIGQYGGD